MLTLLQHGSSFESSSWDERPIHPLEAARLGYRPRMGSGGLMGSSTVQSLRSVHPGLLQECTAAGIQIDPSVLRPVAKCFFHPPLEFAKGVWPPYAPRSPSSVTAASVSEPARTPDPVPTDAPEIPAPPFRAQVYLPQYHPLSQALPSLTLPDSSPRIQFAPIQADEPPATTVGAEVRTVPVRECEINDQVDSEADQVDSEYVEPTLVPSVDPHSVRRTRRRRRTCTRDDYKAEKLAETDTSARPTSRRRRTSALSLCAPGQSVCCVQNCVNPVKNRLRFSCRLLKEEEFKPSFLRARWHRVCHKHYFDDLYQWKKQNGLVGRGRKKKVSSVEA